MAVLWNLVFEFVKLSCYMQVHFLSCILKDYNRWVFNETLELLMLNWKLVLRLLVLQSFYQVANVKSEWNWIKTFTILSGTGFVSFSCKLVSHLSCCLIILPLQSSIWLLLVLHAGKATWVKFGLDRCKILGYGINGTEPPHIWPPWRWWSNRVIKHLQLNLIPETTLSVFPAAVGSSVFYRLWVMV